MDEKINEEKSITSVEEAIEKLKSLEAFNRVLEFWESLSEEDKLALYQHGSQKMSTTVVKGFGPVGTTAKVIEGAFVYENALLKTAGSFLAEPFRVLIQLGLLTPPESLDNDIVKEGIRQDNESVKKTLHLFGVIIQFVAPEFLPEYKMIEKFVGKTYGLKTDIASEAQVSENQEPRD